jgi:hypothetical protein
MLVIRTSAVSGVARLGLVGTLTSDDASQLEGETVELIARAQEVRVVLAKLWAADEDVFLTFQRLIARARSRGVVCEWSGPFGVVRQLLNASPESPYVGELDRADATLIDGWTPMRQFVPDEPGAQKHVA